jgi:hypothetical protein
VPVKASGVPAAALLRWEGMKMGFNPGWVRTVCAIGAIIGVAPGTAHAVSCITNELRVPAPGQVNVPTDTLLWGYPGSATRLLGPAGEVIPMEEARKLLVAAPGSLLQYNSILVPKSNLEPEARYTIEVNWYASWFPEYPPEFIEFSTGPGPAGSPPSQPMLVSSEEGGIGTHHNSCIPARWSYLEFLGIAERGLILLGYAGEGERERVSTITSVRDLLVESPPSAEGIDDGPVAQWVSQGDWVIAGPSDCSTWPDGAPDSLTARFGAFDLAGNFSGWVDVPVALPSEAEAQAAADALCAEANAAAVEADRVAAANLARLAEASQDKGCAVAPGPVRGARGFAAFALALGLAGVARRARRGAAR